MASKNSQLESEILRLKDIERKFSQLEDKDSLINQLRSRNAQLEAELKNWQGKFAENDRLLREKEQRVSYLSSSLANMEDEKRNLSTALYESTMMSSTVNDQESRITNLNRQVSQLEAENRSLRAVNQSTEQKYAEL